MLKYLWVVGVLLVGCGSTDDPPAHVLTQVSQDALASVTPDPADERNATITFSPIPGELADLQVGEIFILPPTKPLARGGLMFRINSMTRANNTLTIQGRQPPLTDVIKEGDLEQDRTLTEDDIDIEATVADALPGESPLLAGLGPRPLPTITVRWPRIDFTDESTLCDGSPMTCSVVGHITLPSPQFNIQLEFDGRGLRRSQFRVNVDAELAMEIRGRVDAPGAGKSIRLSTIFFAPIWLGPYCVVQPRLTIRLGVKATFMFDVVSSGFAGGANLQVGNEWVRDRGNRDLSSATATGTAHAEGMSQTTVLADIYSRAEFAFFFYFISGPYVYFEQGPRIDLGTPRTPFAQVGYHVGTGLGGRFDILDESIVSLIDYSHAIFEFTQYFWHSENSAPIISLFSPVSPAPFALRVTPSEVVNFMVDGYDLEDGPVLDSMVRWTSTVDGNVGAGKHVLKEFYPAGPGYREVTATITDSGGRTQSQTTALQVDSVNPTITILDPAPATYYTQADNPVHAVVTTPYFPSGNFCTAAGNTMTWTSTNLHDVFTPSNDCTGTVKFLDTGSRVLTFTATDRYGQTATGQVTVNAVDVPQCFVTVQATNNGNVDNGMHPTVTLTGIVAPGCISPAYDYFYVSGTPNGVLHQKIFPNGQSVMFTPSTDLADDGFPMVTSGSITPQTLDVYFTHDWLSGSVSNLTPFHLSYQWQPK